MGFCLINNTPMKNGIEQYENDTDFQEFLNREFNKTAVDATMEELAEFAFGGIKEAFQAFEEQKEKNES